MTHYQSGILDSPPAAARYLYFALRRDGDAARGLSALKPFVDGEACVAGLGASLVAALGKTVEGLTEFPNWSSAGVDIPSTPAALWVWLRGDDLGDTLRINLAHFIGHQLGIVFLVITQDFRHRIHQA